MCDKQIIEMLVPWWPALLCSGNCWDPVTLLKQASAQTDESARYISPAKAWPSDHKQQVGQDAMLDLKGSCNIWHPASTQL